MSVFAPAEGFMYKRDVRVYPASDQSAGLMK